MTDAVTDPHSGQSVNFRERSDRHHVGKFGQQRQPGNKRIIGDIVDIGFVQPHQDIGRNRRQKGPQLRAAHDYASRIVRIAKKNDLGARGNRGQHRRQVGHQIVCADRHLHRHTVHDRRGIGVLTESRPGQHHLIAGCDECVHQQRDRLVAAIADIHVIDRHAAALRYFLPQRLGFHIIVKMHLTGCLLHCLNRQRRRTVGAFIEGQFGDLAAVEQTTQLGRRFIRPAGRIRLDGFHYGAGCYLSFDH